MLKTDSMLKNFLLYQSVLVTALFALLTPAVASADDVAAILSAQPAQTTAEQAALAQRLTALGPEAIQQVAAQLVPSGGGDDNAARYALSGLAKEASRPGQEAARQTVARALETAALAAENAEVQDFLLEQLRFVADADTLRAVKPLETNAALAARLAAIRATVGSAQPGPAARAEKQGTLREMTLREALEAVENGNAEARAAGLAAAETMDGKRVSRRFLRLMKKASPEVAAEIRAMLERRGDISLPAGASSEEEDGFTELFNGRNLDGWEGDTTGYAAKDGVLVCDERGGSLYTKDSYSDFIFRFEFKLEPASNSGLGIRVPFKSHGAYDGMELQILDDGHEQYKDIEPYQAHGSIYGVVPAKRGHLKPTGEWNRQEVYAKGNHIKITLNGVVIVDADIAEAAKDGTIDGKEHPGLFNKEGRIALLGHDSPVEFRNLSIQRLD